MTTPYVIPEAARAAPVSVLPTDRLVEIVATFHVLEAALIEIACLAFQDGPRSCGYCEVTADRECWDGCPGLLARRALGVA